ncbi:hypothetical protein GO730_08875 [Spirosoma sp. HMF3257]|uniref:Uncharacterized protein n=1 Tax=Spirosoma telluris TaxID=2183553 RepID=A0A327NNY2_9BACT|nr:hypothetical protein [Spirosoma telluris]RAI74368.1 hypothetical protein HMF3257_08790 [Spirosoma telluris]
MNRFSLVLFISIAHGVVAQHQHHEGMKMPMPNKPAADTTKPMSHSMHSGMDMTPHDGMNKMDDLAMMNYGLTMDTAMGMTHSLSRNLPMNRNGSGTSWHPDNTPMYAYMSQPTSKGWSYMLHYAIYLRYTSQNANHPHRRGSDQQFGAPNWFMGMAQRKVGKRGLFQVRAMLSFDPLTVGNGGYPLLFQTGESYKGQPLIDKQHPHDLVSELSVSYSHAFSKDIDLYGYIGYPGEPALGPPAFMHRISSFNNPDAPLSHHWQDASHILFGVATAGFRYKWAKLEASTFQGREPDENRYNFDKPQFNSYSYRLSVNPSASWALQFSQGFLHSPEEAHPEENITRTTASILHSKALGPGSYVTSAFVWGRNSHDGAGENSFLAESSVQLEKLALYGRYENVTKSIEELQLSTDLVSANSSTYTINTLTLGANYRIAQTHNTDLVLGAQLTGSVTDQTLQEYYGKTPISGEIYLRLSPSLMSMRTMNHSGHSRMKGMNH